MLPRGAVVRTYGKQFLTGKRGYSLGFEPFAENCSLDSRVYRLHAALLSMHVSERGEAKVLEFLWTPIRNVPNALYQD